MMKKAIKKLLAALLAVAMLCAMAVPAFAASSSNDGKITINNAVSGQTYTIYRILELEYDQTNNAYRYTAVAAWNAFINTRSSDLKVDNATGTVTWVNSDKNNNSSAIQNFADAAGKWASDNTIANDGSQKASGSTVTFTDLPLGWYLVVSSLSNGAICSIGTTDKEVTINERTALPLWIRKCSRTAPTPTARAMTLMWAIPLLSALRSKLRMATPRIMFCTIRCPMV